MGADIAEYGVKIKAPEGVDQNVAAFKKIDDAVNRTTNSLTKYAGSFTAAVAKHTSGASMMLRMFGSLGGEAGHLAERLERTAVATEHMIAKTANSASQTRILEAAFKSGSIAAATMEAAQTKLTNARSAAVAIDQQYARAVKASRDAQEAAQISALQVRGQRLTTSTANRAASGSGVFSAETDYAIKQRQLLNLAEKDAIASSNALRDAQSAERAILQEKAAATKEVAAAQRLMNEASAGTTTGFGTAAAVITGLVAILVVLAAGIYAVHKAWHLLTESISEATAQQRQAFPLQALIGNAELAKQKVEELHNFWEQSGVFKFKDLAEAAKSLTLMGTGTDNLMERLKALGTISVATGEDLKGQVAAYERVRLSIEKGTDIQIRGMGAMGSGMLAIIRALMDETGKTESEIMRMFKEHKVSIELVDKALANATTGTGRYATAQEGFMKTLSGAQTVFGTRWEAIKDSLGAPVRDAITPLVTQATQALEGLKPVAEEIGVRIAGIVTAFASIARDTGWTTAIKAAWDVLLSELAIAIQTKLRQAFTSFFLDNVVTQSGADTAAWLDNALTRFDAGFDAAGDKPAVLEGLKKMFGGSDVIAAATNGGEKNGTAFSQAAVSELAAAKARFKTAIDALFAPMGSETIALTLDTEPARKAIEELFKLPAGIIETFGKDASKQFTDGALQEIDLGKADIQLALKDAFKVTGLGSPSLSGTGVAPIAIKPPDTHDIKTEFMGKTGRGTESDWEKYKTDLKIINDYWEEYNTIQSKAASETERTRRVIELEAKTAKELSDPAAYAKGFTTIQGQWAAMEEARLKKTEETDMKIKMGTATVFEAMQSGIQKTIHAWGNMAQKIEKAIGDIADALANDISSGLTDIITGTVDLKTGFTQMAISILKDIAQIIIKMEVQILLQTLLNSLQGGVGGGSSGSGIHAATGGAIHGPSHAGGGVHIEAEGGEFMLRKDAVRNQRMEDLHALNSGRAAIIPKYPNGGLVEPDIPPIGNSGNIPPIHHGPGFYVDPRALGPGATAGGYHQPPHMTTTQYWYGNNSLVNGPYIYRPKNQFGPGGSYYSQFHRDDPSASGSAGISPREPRGPISGGAEAIIYNPDTGQWENPAPWDGPSYPGPSEQPIGSGVNWNDPESWDGPTHSGPTGPTGFDMTRYRNIMQQGLATGSNYNFPGNFSLSPFLGSTLGIPYSIGGQPVQTGNISTEGQGINWNSVRQQWERYLPQTGEWEKVGGIPPPDLSDPNYQDTHDNATGTPGGTHNGPGSTGNQTGPAAATVLRPGQIGAGQYYDWTSGTVRNLHSTNTARDAAFNYGYGQSATSQAGAALMAFQAYGGRPNLQLVDDEERVTNSAMGAHFVGHRAPGQDARFMALYGATGIHTNIDPNTGQNIGQFAPHYHSGGIIGLEGSGMAYMAAGGEVPMVGQTGEGVFTRGQMAALGAGMSGGDNSATVIVNIDSHDNVQTSSSRSKGRSPEEVRQLGELIKAVVIREQERAKRHKGANYVSQDGARY